MIATPDRDRFLDALARGGVEGAREVGVVLAEDPEGVSEVTP